MRSFWRVSASTTLALLFSGLAIAAPIHAGLNPAGVIFKFWVVVVLAFPLALYGAIILDDQVEALYADPRNRPGMVLSSHLLGLGIAGIALLLFLNLQLLATGFDFTRLWEGLPRALTAVTAGGSGLAWGALGFLPREETT